MNGISARLMVLWILTGTAWGAPTLPLEISGDQLTPEFREEALRNKNFVLYIRQGIMELMELYVSENPFMYVDEMSLVEESLNFSPFFVRSCTQTNFQMETCLINSRIVLQKYHMYLTTDVVERHLQNHPLIIKGAQMNVNQLISNIENLLLLLDVNPVATRIEPPRLNFETDFMENVFVYSLLRRVKLLMENTSRVFNYISS